MSGHTPWAQVKKKFSPGRLHDDLHVNKKEVFRFGDWSIYDATRIVTGSSNLSNWSSFIMHCRTWKEWEDVASPPATTGVKGVYVEHFDKVYQILVDKRCSANMTAETFDRCPDCRAKIPNEVVALWKLQNFDQIQEWNSV